VFAHDARNLRYDSYYTIKLSWQVIAVRL